MTTFALVRTNFKYDRIYVERLLSMARRHWPCGDEFNPLIVTDAPAEVPPGVKIIDSRPFDLAHWWAKIILLDPAVRGDADCVYLDLDTLVMGPLEPLVGLRVDQFATCANFSVRAGIEYECNYGSCVSRYPRGWGNDEWCRFVLERRKLMVSAGPLGDQHALEKLVPNAVLLQDVLPKDFVLHYRYANISETGPGPDTSLVVFGGKQKPHTEVRRQWVADTWRVQRDDSQLPQG